MSMTIGRQTHIGPYGWVQKEFNILDRGGRDQTYRGSDYGFTEEDNPREFIPFILELAMEDQASYLATSYLIKNKIFEIIVEPNVDHEVLVTYFPGENYESFRDSLSNRLWWNITTQSNDVEHTIFWWKRELDRNEISNTTLNEALSYRHPEMTEIRNLAMLIKMSSTRISENSWSRQAA